jgi:hypothetical protein
MGDWDAPPTAAELAAVKDPWSAPPTAAEMGHGDTPSVLRSAAEGVLTGGGYGWRDEMVGGYKALAKRVLPKSLGGTDLPLAEQYRQDRDAVRSEQEGFRKAHPVAYGAGEVAGGMVPGTVATLATGGAAALPMALAQGGAAGAGYSNADTAGGLARDTGLGVGIGALGYGAGQAVGKAFSGVAGLAGRGVRLAESRAASRAADEIAAEIASARGSLGGEVQKGQRLVENLRRLGPQLTPEEQAAVAQLEQRLTQSTREALPGQVGTINAKDAELAALQQGASGALKDRTAQLLSTDEMKKQLLTRALRYGPVAAGTALGVAVGGPIGSGIGALAGAGTRPMIRSLRNLAKNPAAQKAVLEAVEDAAPQFGTFLRRAIQASAAGPLTQAAVAP